VLHLVVFATVEGADMKDTQNPIALRSREWLANALLELMKNKPFREISISGKVKNSAEPEHPKFIY